jgi:NAD(P)-dependent dehydrogenase (short-subunit alcohol dehydrogenase family)
MEDRERSGEMSRGHVVVVGGTGGAGPAVVRELAGEGFRVTFSGRSAASVGRVQSLVPSATGRVLDGMDAAATTAFLAEADAVERIVGYVHIAGGWAGGKGIEELTAPDWDAMIDRNFTTLRHGASAAFALMRRRGEGSIVTFGSLAALSGGARSAPYAVSKAAVVAFTRCLAEEGKGCGVRANCIVPGTIDTAGNREAMPDADRTGWIPPERIARVIVYLCGPDSAAVNGSTVLMKGNA